MYIEDYGLHVFCHSYATDLGVEYWFPLKVYELIPEPEKSEIEICIDGDPIAHIDRFKDGDNGRWILTFYGHQIQMGHPPAEFTLQTFLNIVLERDRELWQRLAKYAK